MNDYFDLTQIRGPSWVLFYGDDPGPVVLPLTGYVIEEGHLIGDRHDVDLSDAGYRLWRVTNGVTSEGPNWQAILVWDQGRAI